MLARGWLLCLQLCTVADLQRHMPGNASNAVSGSPHLRHCIIFLLVGRFLSEKKQAKGWRIESGNRQRQPATGGGKPANQDTALINRPAHPRDSIRADWKAVGVLLMARRLVNETFDSARRERPAISAWRAISAAPGAAAASRRGSSLHDERMLIYVQRSDPADETDIASNAVIESMLRQRMHAGKVAAAARKGNLRRHGKKCCQHGLQHLEPTAA
jgi:hypothetical protein